MNIARLVVKSGNNKIEYTVYDFEGTEQMLGGYIFAVCIKAELSTDMLTLHAILSYDDRQWCGIISKQIYIGVDVHGELHYQISLQCRLHFISKAQRYAVFCNRNLQYILQKILDKLPYQYLCQDISIKYWMQYQESAQSVINRLIFAHNMMYFCDAHEDVVVFIDNIHRLRDGNDLYINNAINVVDTDSLIEWRVIREVYANSEYYGYNNDYLIKYINANQKLHYINTQLQQPKSIMHHTDIDSVSMAKLYANSAQNAQIPLQYESTSTNHRIRIGYKYKIYRNAIDIFANNNMQSSDNIFYPIYISHMYRDGKYSNKCIFLHRNDMYAIQPKDINASFQVATVIGADDAIVDTLDGMAKVQFDWQCDNEQGLNSNAVDTHKHVSSNNTAYIPVMNMSAGNEYGTRFMPRPGHRVIIGFIAGNPNKPFIAGSLYQIGNSPAHNDCIDKSYIRTQSFAGDEYNEITLCDAKNAEYIQHESCGDIRMIAARNMIHKTHNGSMTLSIDRGDLKIEVNAQSNVNEPEDPENARISQSSGDIHIHTKHGGMRLDLNSALQADIGHNCKINADKDGMKCVVDVGNIRIRAPMITISADAVQIVSDNISIDASKSIAIKSAVIKISGAVGSLEIG
jgi:uncharacterized protein involved in type VI secretion and phage assembly